MIQIERSSKTRNDAFTVKAKEPGMGRGFSVECATLAEVGAVVSHYYGGHGVGHDQSACPLCKLCEQDNTIAARKKQRQTARAAA